jgi:ribonucleoside-diphosphate reductase beta chain
MTTVINLDPNRVKQPLFFGEPLGLQRYDSILQSKLEFLTKQQLGFFWIPDEIGLTPDILSYETMSDDEKHIYTSNLQYQILLDTVQGRGMLETFMQFVSSEDLESCLNVWQFFENIHSRSYTHIIKNIYPNPSQVFNEILLKPEIITRAKAACKYYNKILATDYSQVSEYDKHKDVYLAIVAVNILEGIRFYVSFACSFAFGEINKMVKSASILSLLARDEQLHLQMSQHILNTLPNESDMWKQVASDCREEVINMFRDAVSQEIDWARYLFQGRNMLGLNENILTKYIYRLANIRAGALGLEKLYDVPSSNPLPWITKWLSNDGFQPEPQATEILSYVTGSIDSSEEVDFTGFEL